MLQALVDLICRVKVGLDSLKTKVDDLNINK